MTRETLPIRPSESPRSATTRCQSEGLHSGKRGWRLQDSLGMKNQDPTDDLLTVRDCFWVFCEGEASAYFRFVVTR